MQNKNVFQLYSPQRLSCVRVLLSLRACAISFAPSSPISLSVNRIIKSEKNVSSTTKILEYTMKLYKIKICFSGTY